jgi:hypothetical protein
MFKYDFSIDHQEDEDLRCPICNYYFSNDTKPYLLPCNHNLCIICIDSIIAKNMYNCPICRKDFNQDDRKNFQVNFAFLNLVIKILKTKVIYCKKCSKIYNWIEHYKVCDQADFKETHEINEEIKKLSEQCYMILNYIDKHKNVLQKSKNMISNDITEILQAIHQKIRESYETHIDVFFDNLPTLSLDKLLADIVEFLDLCKPFNKKFEHIDFENILQASNYRTHGGGSHQRTKSHDSNRNSFINEIKANNPILNANSARKGSLDRLNYSSHILTKTKSALNPYKNYNSNNFFNITGFDGLTSPKQFKIDEENSSNTNSSCNELEENSPSKSNMINSPKNIIIKNLNLETKSPAVINRTNVNNSIVNLNYNFNIGDFIEPDKSSNNTKQMIIVRNEKVEVIEKTDFKETVTPKEKSKTFIPDLFGGLKTQRIGRSKEVEMIRNNKKPTLSPLVLNSDNNISVNNITVNNNLTPIKSNSNTNNPDAYANINKVLAKYNNTKEIVQKIMSYTQQVEFTTECIRNQIGTNYNHLTDNINKDLNGLFDNITVCFNNYPRRYIINMFKKTKKVWLFDSRKRNSEVKEFDSLKHKLNFSMGIEFDDSDLVFLTGGKLYSGVFGDLTQENYASNQFMILRWSNRTIEVSGHIPRKRSFHSTVFFNNKLYLIGGAQNEQTKLKECECYNLIDKCWELLPSLNQARSSASICIYNSQYLYIFRGIGAGNSYLDSIEFLNIRNPINWVIFKPDDPGMSWLPAMNGLSLVIGENKILICGGQRNKDYLNYCYVFDPVKKSVFRGHDLVKKAYFNTAGTIYENNVMVIDYKNETGKQFGVHIYDVSKNLWKFNQI